MLDRLKGFAQEHVIRFQHRTLLESLDKLTDPAKGALEDTGIDAGTLQKLVTEAGQFLTAAEKQKILAVAERPEVKERLPQLLVDQKLPIPELPSSEELQRVFGKDLTDAELRKAEEIFTTNVGEGDFRIFCASKRGGGSRSYLSAQDAKALLGDDQVLQGRLLMNKASGQCPSVYPELANGYKRAKERFRRDAYRELMTGEVDPFSNGDSASQSPSPSQSTEKLMTYMRREALYGHRAAFLTMTRDIYIPTNRDFQEARSKSRAKIGDTADGTRLYQEVPTRLEPYKCIEIIIGRVLPQHIDPRPSNIRLLIILGPTAKIHDMLRNPAENVDIENFGYDTILRALKKDPGFLAKAMKKVVPHAFDMIPHTQRENTPEEIYFPDHLPEADLVMHFDVPELHAVGVPDKLPFQRV